MRAWAMLVLLPLGGCFSDAGGDRDATSVASTSTGTTSTATPQPDTTSDEATTGAPTTGLVEGDACDPFAQDCGPDLKCAPYVDGDGDTWNADKCVPAGSDSPGQECTAKGGGISGYDSCVESAMCTVVDQAGDGVCVALCTGSADEPSCNPGSTCLAVNDGVLNLCVQLCDPLAPACALDHQVCIPHPDDPAFICGEDASVGPPTAGEPCAYINDCGVGLFCGYFGELSSCAGKDGCCVAFCDLEAQMDPCVAPLTCLPYFDDPAPMGYKRVGYCGD